jgi:hypothetical protein
MNRQPLIESLESRQLFATAPLPDLVPTLTFNPPAVVQPGSNIAPTLKITNSGGAIAKKTFVPIRLYASPTRTLAANAKPFKTIQQPLTLTAGQSTTVILSATLPASIKSKTYFLVVKVNNAQALAESNKDNNTVVSPALANPVGTYKGDFSASDGHPGTLTLSITPNADTSSPTASLFTDFTAVTPGGVTIRLPHLKSKISSTGGYQIRATGSYRNPTIGHTAYRITLNATLSNNNTLTGTLKLYYQSNTASRNATCTFTLTRS